jgi:hypothetical protein
MGDFQDKELRAAKIQLVAIRLVYLIAIGV